MAKETAKILVQKRARLRSRSSPVIAKRTSKVAMKAESPMVKAGKMMWNEIVKANCSRASSEASRCIRASFVPHGGADSRLSGALRRAHCRDGASPRSGNADALHIAASAAQGDRAGLRADHRQPGDGTTA